MSIRHRGLWTIIAVLASWAISLAPAETLAGTITVHFDQEVYIVNGPGDTIDAMILIDADMVRPFDQPVPNGLYSYALEMTFDSTKGSVGSTTEVVVPPELDFFGLGIPGPPDPAFITVDPGDVGIHANVDQSLSPLQGYNGTLLATVTLTNLASPIDSYLLNLDFNRDLGLNEDFFLDLLGTTLDDEIMFIPSRVLVVPEPSTAMLAAIGLVLLFCWGWMFHTRNLASSND